MLWIQESHNPATCFHLFLLIPACCCKCALKLHDVVTITLEFHPQVSGEFYFFFTSSGLGRLQQSLQSAAHPRLIQWRWTWSARGAPGEVGGFIFWGQQMSAWKCVRWKWKIPADFMRSGKFCCHIRHCFASRFVSIVTELFLRWIMSIRNTLLCVSLCTDSLIWAVKWKRRIL